MVIPLKLKRRKPSPGKFDQLLSQVDSLDTFDNGYDLRVKGDVAAIRALVDELSAAASCCSPLSFNVRRSARRRSRAHRQHGGQPARCREGIRLLQLIVRIALSRIRHRRIVFSAP